MARARQSGEEGLVHPQDSGPWMSFVGVGPTLPCTLGLHFSQCGSGLGQITVENKKGCWLGLTLHRHTSLPGCPQTPWAPQPGPNGRAAPLERGDLHLPTPPKMEVRDPGPDSGLPGPGGCGNSVVTSSGGLCSHLGRPQCAHNGVTCRLRDSDTSAQTVQGLQICSHLRH